MQAIILAAGMGKRLGELTQHNTKCMVKVNGETLIKRLLHQISTFNLEKIIIVIGYEGEKLVKHVGNSINGIKIEYVTNPVYDRTNNIYSLYLAKDYLQESDTLLFESDLILEDSIIKKLIEHPFHSIAVVDKFQSWMDGTVVTLDDECNIERFISKKDFDFNHISEYYKTVNVYKFSKEFSRSHYVPFLEAYSKALGNNEYYEQVLRVITLLDNPSIRAMPLDDDKWYEIDDIQDLDIAETIFSNDGDKLKLIQNRYGGYWRYPHMLDFCYLVNPYFPTDRMTKEIKANFDELLRQYPSGLTVNSLLAAKYFGVNPKYITVSNGAAETINGYLSNCQLKTGGVLPTFEEYRNRIVGEENRAYFVPQNESFSYTVNDLINYFTDNPVEQLILINPDNPSGNFIPKPDLISLIEWCNNKNIRIIVDESFVDFSNEGSANSIITNKILEKYSNLIVIKSISKSYGVPGLRLGVAATSDETILNDIKAELSIWNINSFAEFYLQIFGKYEKEYEKASEKYREVREIFYNDLEKISELKVIPSQANYFLCKLNSWSATDLTRELLAKYNILIKDCSGKHGFDKQEYIRLAVRNIDDNKKLVDSLISLFDNKTPD